MQGGDRRGALARGQSSLTRCFPFDIVDIWVLDGYHTAQGKGFVVAKMINKSASVLLRLCLVWAMLAGCAGSQHIAKGDVFLRQVLNVLYGF